MSARFEELDFRSSPMGDISLRRRRDPVTGVDVHEVKLDDEYLMSSLFTVAEVEVARLALARFESADVDAPETGGAVLDVVVGGLGLGYTAHTVLADPRVASLVVVDAIAEVIEWHERGLIPLGVELTADPRCAFLLGDFFALFGSSAPDDFAARRFDAIVVDIDHSPRHLLNPRHASLYDEAGTRELASRLKPGGVFTLWSNDPPDDEYVAVLASVFDDVRAEVVSFANPLQNRESTNTVYVAGRSRGNSAPLRDS
jgi:SAM-dependent methyltransferase